MLLFLITYTYSAHRLNNFRSAVWTWNLLPSNELENMKINLISILASVRKNSTKYWYGMWRVFEDRTHTVMFLNLNCAVSFYFTATIFLCRQINGKSDILRSLSQHIYIPIYFFYIFWINSLNVCNNEQLSWKNVLIKQQHSNYKLNQKFKRFFFIKCTIFS